MAVRLLFAVSILLVIQKILSDSRFVNKELFSTTTPYFWSRDANENIRKDDGMVIHKNGEQCEAVYVDGILRHGARYPSLQWIKWMNEVHGRLKGKGVKFIDDWVSIFHENKQNTISTLGQWEQFYLGKRFGARFFKLLENSDIRYFTTDKQRCIDSASEFFLGLRDVQATSATSMNFTVDNDMLRVWEHCEKYIVSVQTNKTALLEYSKFMNGPEMASVVKSVSQNIANGSVTISPFDVVVMQQICAFELAFNNKSEWCQLFTESDLQVIDYMDDVDEYWKTSFGYRINSEMSCPLISSVFSNMDDAISKISRKENSTKAAFRFTHSETVSFVFTALDLFKESTPLLADNYEVHKSRSFRTSNTLPMSANIAFALYKCGMDSDSPSSYKLKVFANEEEVVIPFCQQTTCPYNTVKDALSNMIDCNLEQTCSLPSKASLGKTGYTFYVPLLFFVLQISRLM